MNLELDPVSLVENQSAGYLDFSLVENQSAEYLDNWFEELVV